MCLNPLQKEHWTGKEGHSRALCSVDPQLLHLFMDSDVMAFTLAALLELEMAVWLVS